MKNLKLKFEGMEKMLTKEQMANVKGGEVRTFWSSSSSSSDYGGGSGDCTVGCRSGYYACCTIDTGTGIPTCRCKPDGSSNPCIDGGPGSTSCSINHM